MKCEYHLCDNDLSGKQTRFCSSSCGAKYHNMALQRRIKKELVASLGGKCVLCGYSKYIGALEFHHLVPKDKKFNLSDRKAGMERSLQEVKKCILVCANCHAEIEGGLVSLEPFL